ncbi:MAG: glycosyltransferase family 2 protein [Candidatus Omnitrophica bacterium]|nr:glycosyltransferase family 2 protein [Candidatus Omnitrophota bacterium]
MIHISIVILTYNSANYIKSCLDSVYLQRYQNFEVIVVDNGSKDDTVSLIKKNYPQVILIENKDNLGACKGRNQGIEVGRGEWIFTLDCDIILRNDFMGEIIKIIKSVPKMIGMLQPKIMKIDKIRVFSAGIYVSFLRRFHDVGKDEIDSAKFSKQMDIFGVCSAATVYKRDMLEAVRGENGYFDERFFFLFEDVDLSWRAQKKGIKALFCPDAACYHYGNSSCTPEKTRQYLCLRNRYFTLLKNDFIGSIILSFVFYDLPRLLYIFMANPRSLRAIKDIFDFKRS